MHFDCTFENSHKSMLEPLANVNEAIPNIVEYLKNKISLLKEMIQEKVLFDYGEGKTDKLISKENQCLQQNYVFLLSNINSLTMLSDKIVILESSPKSFIRNFKS